MFLTIHGIPTDDADRDFTGTMEEFEPGDDYDPMYEGPGSGGYKCGRGDFGDIPCCCDDNGKFVGGGCRHCCPVDHECKPYGFGLEPHDSPAWEEARRFFRAEWRFLTGLNDAHPVDHMDMIRKWAVDGGWNHRLYRASERKWERLCDECETHEEAVTKYTRWAKRVTSRLVSL